MTQPEFPEGLGDKVYIEFSGGEHALMAATDAITAKDLERGLNAFPPPIGATDFLHQLYDMADDSPLRGFGFWGVPAILTEEFPDSICTDVRNRRGTPGLVPYDPEFAALQQQRWVRDSEMERAWLNGDDE